MTSSPAPKEQTGDRLMRARARIGAWQRIASARRMQEEVYGYDFRTMLQSPRKVCDYLAHMAMGILSELNEVMYEFEWKRWTTDPPWFDRDRIIDELIDLDMFSDNMKAAMQCSDEEYVRRYQAKQEANRIRMARGYAQRDR